MAKEIESAGTVEVVRIEKGRPVKITRPRVIQSDAEWRRILSPEAYRVLRQKGTERPFSGAYCGAKEVGIYQCAACDNDLFVSETKFESGTGWPSFFNPVAPENIKTVEDNSILMRRTEVLCSVCDGHLGHVFEDGPPPTGLRYCINSDALKLKKTP